MKFESAKPTRELSGYAQLAYGTDNMWNFEGAVGGPLSERWSARVSALYQRKDDWVTNTYAAGTSDGFEGYDESAARVQFLYEGEAFEGLFNLHKRHLNGTARLFRANIFQPGSNDFVPGFDRDTVERVLRLVRISEWTRRQSAPGPKLSKRAFGRERRYPISSGYTG